MKIEFPVTLTAADSESRIIAGRIVQWDSQGNTSAGATVFKPNSIDFSNNTAILKLIIKSLVVSFIVGAILGLLNMVLKIGKFQKKENP